MWRALGAAGEVTRGAAAATLTALSLTVVGAATVDIRFKYRSV